eukprot:1047779_1
MTYHHIILSRDNVHKSANNNRHTHTLQTKYDRLDSSLFGGVSILSLAAFCGGFSPFLVPLLVFLSLVVQSHDIFGSSNSLIVALLANGFSIPHACTPIPPHVHLLYPFAFPILCFV